MSKKGILAKYEALLATTRRPYVEVKARPAGKPLPAWKSKFGGLPYVPRGAEVPTDKKKQPLSFLAQLDLSEVPPLEHFPTEGLLQFWIGRGDFHGMNYDDRLDQSGFRVKYFPSVVPGDAQTDATLAERTADDEGPVRKEYKLTFAAKEMVVQRSDVAFTRGVGKKIAEEDQDDFEDALRASKHRVLAHRLGGYGTFVQEDPRKWDAYKRKRLDVVLLCVESLDDILWGDCGVANFLISEAALRKRDFSRVLYTWDCG